MTGRRGPGGAVLAALALVLGAACTSDDDTDAGPERSTTSTTEGSGSTTTVLAPSRRAVVVGAEGVAGWWDGRSWVSWDAGEVPVVGGERYDLLRLGDPTAVVTGGPLVDTCMPEGDGAPRVELEGRDWYDVRPPGIAVSGVADPTPRPAELLDPGAATYRTAATEVLQGLGLEPDGSSVVQVVRADLDGDGTGEVLVVTERIPDPQLFGAPGDHSVLFLRQVDGNRVRTTVLFESSVEEPPYVVSFRVAAVADLNGDGRLEVVTSARYYEGGSTVVHEIERVGATEVLAAGCGA